MKGAGEKEAGQVPAPAASIITQDNAHRFVTDEEKTNWNGKVNTGDIVNNCTSTATNTTVPKQQENQHTFSLK